MQYFTCSRVFAQVAAPFVLGLYACVLVHVPACVFSPAALERHRECQEAVEAAGSVSQRGR